MALACKCAQYEKLQYLSNAWKVCKRNQTHIGTLHRKIIGAGFQAKWSLKQAAMFGSWWETKILVCEIRSKA